MIPLEYIHQIPSSGKGIVSVHLYIPVGEAWSLDKILELVTGYMIVL